MSRTFSSNYATQGASFRIKITKNGVTDTAPIVYEHTISAYNLYGVATGSVITQISETLNLEPGDYYAVLDDQ